MDAEQVAAQATIFALDQGDPDLDGLAHESLIVAADRAPVSFGAAAGQPGGGGPAARRSLRQRLARLLDQISGAPQRRVPRAGGHVLPDVVSLRSGSCRVAGIARARGAPGPGREPRFQPEQRDAGGRAGRSGHREHGRR